MEFVGLTERASDILLVARVDMRRVLHFLVGLILVSYSSVLGPIGKQGVRRNDVVLGATGRGTPMKKTPLNSEHHFYSHTAQRWQALLRFVRSMNSNCPMGLVHS